ECPRKSEHRELLYRQFQATKECMELTGKAMSEDALEGLHHAERCKEALDAEISRPLRNLWMLREPLLRDCLQTRPNLRLLAAVCHPQWRSRKDQSQAGSILSTLGDPLGKAHSVANQSRSLEQRNHPQSSAKYRRKAEGRLSRPSRSRFSGDLADAAAKAGKHASALRMYEELLERCPDVGRMAILCSFVVLLDRAVHLRWCAKLRDLSSTLGG
ncbi:unnamed protein product, partial [Cladocopium goreaui]